MALEEVQPHSFKMFESDMDVTGNIGKWLAVDYFFILNRGNDTETYGQLQLNIARV